MPVEKKFEDQVSEGRRFKFGMNWQQYLKTLSDERIRVAELSVVELVGVKDLSNLKFLDIGCGSGLFSLAATNLGATVHSVDFDPSSVECAKLLKEKFHQDKNWTMQEGSVLDKDFVSSVGDHDIVYSWGVLHHTGNLDLALTNALIPVRPGGKLVIGIYNDQEWKSKFWLKVKALYNRNVIGKYLVCSVFIPYWAFRGLAVDCVKLKNPLARYREYRKKRGMSILYDWYDWLGGLPFEVATPEYIFEFYKKKNCILEKMTTTNGLGINQFVFKKG